MDILYVKSVHIIFVVSWFAGLFYMVRLFIYHREAADLSEPKRSILSDQYKVMQQRLWSIITTPSMVLTLASGLYMLYLLPGYLQQGWMHVKLTFVVALVGYHLVCWRMMRRLRRDEVVWTSFRLRLWNEGATVLLFAIVFLVVLKSSVDWLWGLLGLVGFAVVIMMAAKLYKRTRERRAPAESSLIAERED